MEIITVLAITIVCIIIFNSDKSKMDQSQLQELQKIEGETQLEKAKAKFSLFALFSYIVGLFKH